METKHLDIILTEMCKKVGIEYKDVDFTEKYWFMKHSWTESEEEEFKEWLIDYWYNNTEARREMFRTKGMKLSKKRINDAATWFLFDYGWKIDEEAEI